MVEIYKEKLIKDLKKVKEKAFKKILFFCSLTFAAKAVTTRRKFYKSCISFMKWAQIYELIRICGKLFCINLELRLCL